MLKVFLNINTRRVITADTKGIVSPLVSLRSRWILWREVFSSHLNCRLLKIWYFMYSPVVLINVSGLEFWDKTEATQQRAFVSLTILYSIRSVYIMTESMRTMSLTNSGLWGPLPLNITPNSMPTLLPKLCPSPYDKMQDQILQLQGKSQNLGSSRHFNSAKTFSVVVSFMNGSVHSFDNICIGRVNTRFQIV